MTASFSFSSNAWKRLKKNRGAVLGMVVIGLAFLAGLFAYFLAEDPTPNADRQIVEIQAREPGFRQEFLLVNREKQATRTPFFHRLLFGVEDSVVYIPINSYSEEGDSVVAEKFVDAGIQERRAYARNRLPSHRYIVTRTFWLGTDKFGRDMMSRLLLGIRVSMAVGFISLVISLTIGMILGALAGYFGGRVDNVIMWLINVIWSMPTLLLVFGITLSMGKGFWQIFIAVGLTMWVNVARVIRGQVLALRELDYIQAARALGLSDLRIIVRHIFPNVVGPVMVIAASNFASAIIIEAGLSFLGVGVQPPTPSWGLMINENYNFIITHHPALALAPGIAIMILVLAFNLLGNGLRDALDVRS